MIDNILVPTDFSETAVGALRYAWHLGRRLNAVVTVFHVYHPSFDLSNPYLDVPVQDFGELKQKAMTAFIREAGIISPEDQAAGRVPRTEQIIGFAGEEIVARASKTDLIVMGKTGAGRRPLENVFGSVSSFTAQHAHCPVLLIPHQVEYREIDEVMYASNFASADEALLQRVLPALNLFPGEVYLVHAEEEDEAGYQAEESDRRPLNLKDGRTIWMHSVKITCQDIFSGLSRYAQEREMDLIIMGTVHRSFLERLFHRSLTRKMIFNLKQPLLILHFDD